MIRWAATVIVLLAAVGLTRGQNVTVGKVSRVLDGDSLIINLSTARSVEVRLAEIDAPEQHQPFAGQSRTALQSLLVDQEVSIELYDIDRYGRAVARVWRSEDGLYVNAWMVQNGYAWVYPRYAEDPLLERLQQQAISDDAGLWALPETDRIPPWKWRRIAAD